MVLFIVAALFVILSVAAATVSIVVGPLAVMIAGVIVTVKNRKKWGRNWKRSLVKLVGGILLSPSAGLMLASHFLYGKKAKEMWGWRKSIQLTTFAVYSTIYWLMFVLVVATHR